MLPMAILLAMIRGLSCWGREVTTYSTPFQCNAQFTVTPSNVVFIEWCDLPGCLLDETAQVTKTPQGRILKQMSPDLRNLGDFGTPPRRGGP